MQYFVTTAFKVAAGSQRLLRQHYSIHWKPLFSKADCSLLVFSKDAIPRDPKSSHFPNPYEVRSRIREKA